MSQIEEYVRDIQNKLANFKESDLIRNGRVLPFDTAILCYLNLDKLSQDLTEIIGRSDVVEFFEGHSSPEANHFIGELSNAIHASIQIDDNKTLSICSRITEYLESICKVVRAGVMDYQIALRVINFDIDREFTLGKDIVFHKLTREELESKYPINEHSSGVSQMVREHWCNHCVEATISKKGKPVDVREELRIEKEESLVNDIIHAFTLANIIENGTAGVTHYNIHSLIDGSSSYRGFRSFTFEPKILQPEETILLNDTYSLLKNSTDDRIYHQTIDRFLIGRKQNTNHPNRINEPNWDKIVNYAIALESMLLSVNGDGIDAELSYRFSINGASLLSRCNSDHNSEKIFKALKFLYRLRSKVVHSSKESDILKAANDFVKILEIDNDNLKHSLGRLSLVSKTLENWITKAIYYLNDVPKEKRPFNKQDGWEELLGIISTRD